MTIRDEENRRQEALFQKRLAERRAEQNQFPWSTGGSDSAEFNIPKEESKLFADRSIEDASLSDDEVERRALLDLTSYNFWTFYKRLNYEVKRARRYKRDLALLLVAVDGLHDISQAYGLQLENTIILSSGRILLGSIRDVDIAGRCRDDTFGVILPETPVSGVEVAAERLRTKMEEHTVMHGHERISITVSVGGTNSIEGDKQADVIVARAIEALKHSMQRGNMVTLR
jgi:diguanylate cyclase (GGDEF)-like protein